jgi:hypothetical protein
MWKSQLHYIKLLKAATALANAQEPYVVKLRKPSCINEFKVIVNDRKRPALIEWGVSSVRLNYFDSGTWKSQDGIEWICMGIQNSGACMSAIGRQAIGRIYRSGNYDSNRFPIFLEPHREKFLEEKIAKSDVGAE